MGVREDARPACAGTGACIFRIAFGQPIKPRIGSDTHSFFAVLGACPFQKNFRCDSADSPYLARHGSAANPDGLRPLNLSVELTRGVPLSGRVVDGASGRSVFADIHYIPLPNNPFVGKPPYDPDRQHEYVRSTGPDGRFHLAVIPGPGILAVHTHGDERLDGQQLSPYLPGDITAEDAKRVTIVERGGSQRRSLPTTPATEIAFDRSRASTRWALRFFSSSCSRASSATYSIRLSSSPPAR